MKRVIRNIRINDILLALAQANSINCPFVDLKFDTERRSVTITPISRDESIKRFTENKGETSMEDIINES